MNFKFSAPPSSPLGCCLFWHLEKVRFAYLQNAWILAANEEDLQDKHTVHLSAILAPKKKRWKVNFSHLFVSYVPAAFKMCTVTDSVTVPTRFVLLRSQAAAWRARGWAAATQNPAGRRHRHALQTSVSVRPGGVQTATISPIWRVIIISVPLLYTFPQPVPGPLGLSMLSAVKCLHETLKRKTQGKSGNDVKHTG